MSKKTVTTINVSGNDYVIGVKRNQRVLYKYIASVMDQPHQCSSRYVGMNYHKGRLESRAVWVSDAIEGINGWDGLQQIIKVHRLCYYKGGSRQQTAYYISSVSSNAFMYYDCIRSHWQIENNLHRVKDVSMMEDACKIRSAQGPQNLSLIRNIAINIFRLHKYKSITRAIRLVANNISKIKQLLI